MSIEQSLYDIIASQITREIDNQIVIDLLNLDLYPTYWVKKTIRETMDSILAIEDNND